MVSLGRSLTFTMLDFSYLFHSPLPAGRKLRLTLTYCRLALQFFLVKLLRLQPHRARLLGMRVSYDHFPTFAFLYREIFIKQEYAFPAHKKPVIIDCGANIGMSMLYFKSAYPDARIYAFEPLPHNFAHLERNASPFHDVEPIQAAVGTKDGRVTFYFDADTPSSGVSSLYKVRGGKSEVSVRMVRLSTFIRKKRPTVVKMDIEGAEYEVLKDLDRTGAIRIPRMFLFEYHHHIGNGASLPEFLAILERNGFKYYLDVAIPPPLDAVLRKTPAYQDVMVYAIRS